MLQAVVISCLQERAPVGWLKRWKLSGSLKQVTRTVNCDHLCEAFRSFMALSQWPSHVSSADVAQVASHAPGHRTSARKKPVRTSKKRSESLTGSGKYSVGQSEGVRTIAEELLAKAGRIGHRCFAWLWGLTPARKQICTL